MSIDNLIGNSFRGCILIQKAGKMVLEKAYGYADLANEVGNEVHTKFATASAGKVFVAVGILQLIEKGLLKLEDSIGKIIDIDWRHIDTSITIEELLTHTSGVPDYFDESILDDYEELWVKFPNYKIRSNSDLIPLFIEKPMMYPRGCKFQYNNTGFVILAMIIEYITNSKFDDYLSSSIFKPCGMINTGYYELDKLPAKCANNYIYNKMKEEYRTNIYSVDVKGTGAGGAYTTVNDIRLFWEHLLFKNLLTEEMTTKMLMNHSGERKCYGYGIWLEEREQYLNPYFQGSDPGVSFISGYDIQKELLIVIVSNYGDDVWRLFKDIKEYFKG